ncbi:ABC-type sugar transport system permease subunit [Microbacterium sp. W4I4]|uniref:carbohydrate ABC transporter permease n=1 Tax=Microbacterium sp. W4I4 TaxID=3042295 RepID=UPI00278A0869|nr:sugar ABC transporter permease [Microbacterium sp. W4I4]MDQ0615089.1 ABC-type sugar transport system permease subunit [Microbacterium sp. W4I4]
MSDQSSMEGGVGVASATALLPGDSPLHAAPETRPPALPRRGRLGIAGRGRLVLLGFVAPALVIYLLMVIVPSLQSVQLSFTNWDGISEGYDYVGTKNYQDILTDDRFWNAVRNTLVLGLGSAVVINIIALVAALMLDRLNHLQGLFRTAVYLPALVSAFIMATIWKYLLNYNFGSVNSVLRDLGLPDWARDWLGDSSIVVWVILFITCFTLGGNTTLIYLANLQSVPQELLEAARIDGAGAWKVFWNVTWPMIAGAITVNMTLAMIAGWVIFDQVMVLTSGGPGFVSETMAFFIYKVGFGEYRAGFGSAAAVVLFIVVIISTVGANAYMRKREIQA